MRLRTLAFALVLLVSCHRRRSHVDVVVVPLAPPPDSLASRVAARIRAMYPELSVQISNESTLVVGLPDAEAGTTSLDNLRRVCALTPENCDPSIDRFARSFAQVVHPIAPDRASLRAVVRDQRFVDGAARQSDRRSMGGLRAFVQRPFVGDLFVLYVIDLPDSMSFVNGETARTLQLDANAIHDVAMANSSAAFADLPHEPIAPGSPVERVHTGDSYESSRFLFLPLWQPIRRSVRGDLLVSVPMRDAILFAGSGASGALDALRAETARLESLGDHPISTTIFRWTPAGWTVFERPAAVSAP